MSGSTGAKVRVPRVSPDETGASTISRTLMRIRPVQPSPADLVDAGFVVVMSAVSLWGFHATFTGVSYLLVGLTGCVLGLLMAHIAHSLRLPVATLIALTVVTFFLTGSVLALRSVPAPGAFSSLVHQVLHGWKDMLTTLPPVDGSGPLLVLPYVLGLMVGAVALALAEGSRRSWPPVVALLTLLGAVILLGVQRPASLFVQGATFGVLALAWITLRGFRGLEPVRNGTGQWTRAAMGAGIIAVALALSVPLGGDVLASGADRVVLRDHVRPPFDVGLYPSPLSAFRLYAPPVSDAAKAANLNKEPLFSVSGIRAGTLIRIATLDAYDGRTWGAANTGGSPGQIDDTFQRVSSTIDNPLALGSKRYHVTVTVDDGYSGVWMPTVGDLTGLTFRGSDATQQSQSWRYNLASATAVQPTGLGSGTSYSMTVSMPDERLSPNLGASGDVTVDSGDFLQTDATDWARDAGDNPLDKVLAIAKHFKDSGAYTDGKAPFQRYTGGHYAGRLLTFVEGDQIAGDDEQYAAAMALMANDEGVPARVVLGAVLPRGGVVTGADVNAWVELRVSDGTWRTLPTSAFLGTQPPDPHPPQTQTNFTGAVVPPPAPVPPPSTVSDPADSDLQTKVQRHHSDKAHHPLAHLPGWTRAVAKFVVAPVGAVGLLAGSVVLLKRRRRHGRRHAANPAARFSGGWAEILDRAHDLGIDLPVGSLTRSEQARSMPSAQALAVARSADDHVFGAQSPTDAQAVDFWTSVDEVRKSLSDGVGLPRRIRAAVDPRTLRLTSLLSARSGGATVGLATPSRVVIGGSS